MTAPPISPGVIGREQGRGGRWYVDPAEPELRYESVTSAIGQATSRSFLIGWAATIAAQYAVDHLELVQLTAAESSKVAAVKLIAGEADRIRDVKADIGTHAHKVIEALILDLAIPPVPDHLVGVEVDGEAIDHEAITDGFLAFVEDYAPSFEMAEATVVSVLHGYAGTLDLLASFPSLGLRLVLDAKTGRYLDATMAAQLSAYERADEVWLDDLGRKAPMPPVDGSAVLHLRPEYQRGYKLLRVDTGPDTFRWFLQMLAVAKGHRERPKLPARALYPPLPDGSQPPPLVEDVEALGAARGPLIAAGLLRLDQVADQHPAALKLLKGLGPKRLLLIAEQLGAHGIPYDLAQPVEVVL